MSSEIKENNLQLYNSLSRKKERFEPIKSPFVGMYVCGPTVYGDAHLGHARPGIAFDIVFRYLKHLGYKVRYVRNITDVGHLENDADHGEDKIAKKARLEQLEPMEIAQYFADRYHDNMDTLNVQRPSIEPRASGHIIEQMEMVNKILDSGFAYETNGSVYFDVVKYNEKHNYGKLSGRNIEDVLENTRVLDGQEEKKDGVDFAIWKNASPEHIMRWNSPWGSGFPGWHMECSAMSTKYLGERFDIHGGGMDLRFPHHESEIAQSVAANGEEPVKYWMHNNMVTINGQKMGKSLGNFITLDEFFTGNHKFLEQAYAPMTIRFFILQAHYRSTVDFSNEALQAAQKGFEKLMTAVETLDNLKVSDSSDYNIQEWQNKCYAAMDDDFNSPILIANLFDGVKMINSINDGKAKIDTESLKLLKSVFNIFVFEVLGLRNDEQANNSGELSAELIELMLKIRTEAKLNKDWTTADKIRDELKSIKVIIKDTKEGTDWTIEK
ncbi:MAG: cysteine--tRNA ligase [Bacteroidetes bacterium]|nr:MAG: cysteine--tRNA ligase [Bacteroidota bacterium]